MNTFPLNDLKIELENELNYEYVNDYVELFDVSYDNHNKWFNFDIVMLNTYCNDQENTIYIIEIGYVTELKYNINCDNEVDYEELEDMYFNDNSEKDWQTIAIFEDYKKALEYCHKILQVDTLEKQLKKDGYKLI